MEGTSNAIVRNMLRLPVMGTGLQTAARPGKMNMAAHTLAASPTTRLALPCSSRPTTKPPSGPLQGSTRRTTSGSRRGMLLSPYVVPRPNGLLQQPPPSYSPPTESVAGGSVPLSPPPPNSATFKTKPTNFLSLQRARRRRWGIRHRSMHTHPAVHVAPSGRERNRR